MVKKTFVSALFTFAYFPNYDKAIAYLAEILADPEDWEFSDASKKNHSILKNYLEPIVSKINLRKITLRRINSGGIDVFALHFNW